MSNPPKNKGRRTWNAGLLLSIVFHGSLILFLIQLVRPALDLQPPPKRQVIVELAPPPPPPPPPKVVPPPPKETPPPPPPKAPPPPTPPPPVQQPVTEAKNAVEEPSVAPPAPPEPAPVAQPAPRAVGTGVPTSYYNTLQSVIAKNVQYPTRSLRNEEEGVCKLRVRIDRDGNILEVDLLDKSGFANLDKEGRDVFRRIGKFPPVPASVGPEFTEFLVELPINFKLN